MFCLLFSYRVVQRRVSAWEDKCEDAGFISPSLFVLQATKSPLLRLIISDYNHLGVTELYGTDFKT